VIAESRFLVALKRRFRTPQEVLKHLGLDENLLESEDDMAKPVSEKISQMHAAHIIAMDARARSMPLAHDARRARDQEEMAEADPDDEDDNKLEQVIQLLSELAEDRRKRAKDRKARDGAGPSVESDPSLIPSSGSRGAEDRRRYAHDSNGLIIDERFLERFPEAGRVRMA
jgi:hypothetical protein